MSARCDLDEPKKNMVAVDAPENVKPNHPPTHPDAQHTLEPTVVCKSADANL